MAKTKWSEIKAAALHLAMNRDSYYCNSYPFNCLYYTLAKGFGCDCIGLIKSLINNPTQAYTTADQTYVQPGTVIPDWTEQQLIDACKNKSRDFSTVTEGEILMTVFDGQGEEYGHGGWFVGDFVDEKYGCVCNTIECTTCYEYNGIITTWTDPATGCHYTSRGGRYIGKWDYHGFLQDYVSVEAKPSTEDEGLKAVTDWLTNLNGSMAEFSAISLVYDTDFYYNGQPDIAETIGRNPDALLNHFITYGMAEGRKAKETFDVQEYKKKNKDLQEAFGDCLPKYYLHYITSGWKEGR